MRDLIISGKRKTRVLSDCPLSAMIRSSNYCVENKYALVALAQETSSLNRPVIWCVSWAHVDLFFCFVTCRLSN